MIINLINIIINIFKEESKAHDEFIKGIINVIKIDMKYISTYSFSKFDSGEPRSFIIDCHGGFSKRIKEADMPQGISLSDYIRFYASKFNGELKYINTSTGINSNLEVSLSLKRELFEILIAIEKINNDDLLYHSNIAGVYNGKLLW